MPVVIVVGVGPSVNVDGRGLNAFLAVKREKPAPARAHVDRRSKTDGAAPNHPQPRMVFVLLEGHRLGIEKEIG